MTEYVDLHIAQMMFDKIGFPKGRVIYGQLETARNWWVRYNAEKPGVAMRPYMAFFRKHRFHDTNKMWYDTQMLDVANRGVHLEHSYCWLDYTIEIIDGPNVAEGEGGILGQNRYIKEYMTWAAKQTSFKLLDADGIEWPFRIVVEDPEDNSDLEAFESGTSDEVLRTTFNFAVESYLVDRATSPGVIEQLHLFLHSYTGDTDESTLYKETILT